MPTAGSHGSPHRGSDAQGRSGCRTAKHDTMNIKRMRGRGGNRHGGGGGHFRHGSGGGGGGGGGSSDRQPLNRNHVFDSSGPDMRLRGTAQQLFEKYLQLGRDATSGGDRVMAESYFQHAEHYFRILNAMNQAAAQHQQTQQRRFQGQGEGEGEPQGEAMEVGAPGGSEMSEGDEAASEARETA
jgi:hypothetical protein